MKILYHHRIASKDGQYVHIEEIVNALKSLGHEIIMVEPAAINQKQFGESSRMVKNIRSKLPSFVHEIIEFCYSFHDYLKIRKAIKRHRPDAIYERYNLFFPSGIWAKKRFKLPLILEVNSPLYDERAKHDSISLGRLARWSEQYVWQNADIVLPVTRVLADIVCANSVNRDNVVVIPNGINRAQFSQVPAPPEMKQKLGFGDKLIMGFTGFVREWHGLDRVLSVIANNKDDEWLLLVVGDGPARKSLESQAAKLGISERVIFTGIVGRDKVPDYVSCFDIALQPDVVDYASPLKLFEYLVLGKPVLAPDSENIREVLTHEKNAILFNSTKDRDFQDQLARLCESDLLRNELGTAARQLISEQGYYWDENARKITLLFESLLEQRPDNTSVKEAR